MKQNFLFYKNGRALSQKFVSSNRQQAYSMRRCGENSITQHCHTPRITGFGPRGSAFLRKKQDCCPSIVIIFVLYIIDALSAKIDTAPENPAVCFHAAAAALMCLRKIA